MGDGTLIDVVLFAMVAAFLFLRLRSVLGRRTGQERPRPNPFTRPAPDQQRPDSRPENGGVVPLPTARGEGARGEGARGEGSRVEPSRPKPEAPPASAA